MIPSKRRSGRARARIRAPVRIENNESSEDDAVVSIPRLLRILVHIHSSSTPCKTPFAHSYNTSMPEEEPLSKKRFPKSFPFDGIHFTSTFAS